MPSDVSRNDWENVVVCGDAQTELKKLPDAVVDCVVTSPPYYGQRQYHGEGEIGRELTPQEYVDRLASVFREVRRVLKPTGTCWVVLGDKYIKGRLLGAPWRVALAMIDDDWILRRDIIWHKPNAMPSAARNRPTVDHEYVFLFVRTPHYHYNADAIREQHVTFSEQSRMKGGRKHFYRRGGTPESGKNGGNINLHDGRWDQAFHPLGRNKRTVWSIPLSKSRDAHFAVFPELLVETCIAAGCPAGGLVLDPFLGSGVTAVVAKKMGRRYHGIDCVASYCEIARSRLTEFSTPTDS
jgi:site-specific DNA-methyltransferase (adenine-specific)